MVLRLRKFPFSRSNLAVWSLSTITKKSLPAAITCQISKLMSKPWSKVLSKIPKSVWIKQSGKYVRVYPVCIPGRANWVLFIITGSSWNATSESNMLSTRYPTPRSHLWPHFPASFRHVDVNLSRVQSIIAFEARIAHLNGGCGEVLSRHWSVPRNERKRSSGPQEQSLQRSRLHEPSAPLHPWLLIAGSPSPGHCKKIGRQTVVK